MQNLRSSLKSTESESAFIHISQVVYTHIKPWETWSGGQAHAQGAKSGLLLGYPTVNGF